MLVMVRRLLHAVNRPCTVNRLSKWRHGRRSINRRSICRSCYCLCVHWRLRIHWGRLRVDRPGSSLRYSGLRIGRHCLSLRYSRLGVRRLRVRRRCLSLCYSGLRIRGCCRLRRVCRRGLRLGHSRLSIGGWS